MTEAEWLACKDPAKMLLAVERRASERKFRLFACACCRRIWHLLPDEACQVAVERGEEYADRLVSRDDLVATLVGLESSTYSEERAYRAATAAWHSAAVISRRDMAYFAAYHSVEADEAPATIFTPAIVGLIRDIFGNPFRPVAFSPSWRTDTAVSLARQMYESRDFSAMPMLADALQDAGCDSDDVLPHCRGPGPHVRGCWVVDLVLGKE